MTAILETALAKTTTNATGANVSRKRLLADLMVEFVTTGVVTMPDGTMLQAAPRDWIETVKWVYTHIDGPAKQEIEQSGALTIRVLYADPDIDAS